MQYTPLVYYNILSFSRRLTVFILSLSNLLTDTLFINALHYGKACQKSSHNGKKKISETLFPLS